MMADCGTDYKTTTRWFVFSANFILIYGGRYSDPDETVKLAVPFVATGIIFMGMLLLLCYFQRRAIKDRCCSCCFSQAEPGLEVAQNANTDFSPNATSTMPSIAKSTNIVCHQYRNTSNHESAVNISSITEPQVSSEIRPSQSVQKPGQSTCPGCGSPMSQGQMDSGHHGNESKETQNTGVRRFMSFFKTIKRRDNADSGEKNNDNQVSEEMTCGNCFPMSYKRKALKEQDITNLKLSIETSDSCHI